MSSFVLSDTTVMKITYSMKVYPIKTETGVPGVILTENWATDGITRVKISDDYHHECCSKLGFCDIDGFPSRITYSKDLEVFPRLFLHDPILPNTLLKNYKWKVYYGYTRICTRKDTLTHLRTFTLSPDGAVIDYVLEVNHKRIL